MSYIGRGVDNISNVEKLDNITFDGGTTYALEKSSVAYTPSGANNILISIDGVVQQGNFSVSTTNIVFDWSPTSSNTCDWILHIGVGVLNVPADGSIVAAKMAANSVDSDSYVDGSIDLAHMSSESVDEDNLHISNAGSNDQFLQKQSGNAGGLTWAAAGGVDDGDVTMAKLSTSGTESDNVENRVCKVWVQFNGTGTVAIQSDFNVGSISDYDTGQYGVNFSTALGDNDFAAVSGGVCAGGYGANTRVNDLSTSLCKIDNYSTSSYTDSAIVTLVLMGNSA